jgi:hypothetical protein
MNVFSKFVQWCLDVKQVLKTLAWKFYQLANFDILQ